MTDHDGQEQPQEPDAERPLPTAQEEAERTEDLLKGNLDTEDVPESEKTNEPIVVGIGASAGGLEALSAFFDTIPPDTGLTFVVVTHLSPDHESVLDELLQRHTRMPVIQVRAERVRIAPNHVYIISPNRQLVLTDQHLHTAEFNGPRAPRAPIDTFFRSLATVHSAPIGIVLSGGGSDGALGIRSVKEASGIVLVQAPEDAAHDSMPLAAIATGVADFVMPVRDLARKVVEINHHRVHVPSDVNALSTEQMDALQRILLQLQARTGHDFRAYKQSTVLRRVQRRLQLSGHETLPGYLAFLRQNTDETQLLLRDLLIGVTNFFRDDDSWQYVADHVIPELFQSRGPDEGVRVWSLGCSTGEEAYSLAILLMEYAATLDRPPQLQVFATDLDEASLLKARDGLYPDTIATDVSPERLARYFTREGSYYRVRREVRDIVLFATHSVLRDPPFSRLDLIACRNLLIYLQRPLQDNLFDIFHYALRPGGFVFLGSSESADGATELFETVDKKHRVYRTRDWSSRQPTRPLLPLTGYLPRLLTRPRRSESPPSPGDTLVQSTYEQTLEEFGPATILVDREANIQRLSGTAGRYLRHPDGSPTQNLNRLIHPGLQVELRGALFQAFQNGLATVSAAQRLTIDGEERRVVLAVRPRLAAGEPSLALVMLLETQDSVDAEAGEEPTGDMSTIRQLEVEVRYLRERLQASAEEYETSNEELKASNEELQSINEEYRSTTEELETSKEELQSVNEELETVNTELKISLEQVSRAHSDLQNLMAATEIATLFLDRELRIKRYTAGVEGLFNIMATDRGRPLEHLTHQLDYPELVDDARTVLRTLMPLEREVHHTTGGWFLARLRPYRTVDDRIEGIVMTFVDITRIKEVEHSLDESRRNLQQALWSADIGWGTYDLASGVLEQDARARAIAGLPAEGPLSLEQYLAVIHPDDRPRVERDLQERLAAGHAPPLEYRLIWPDGDVRHIRATGLLRVGSGRPAQITGTLEDVTDRRRNEESLRALTETLEARVLERTRELEAVNADLAAARDHFQLLFHSNPIPSTLIRLDDLTYLDANQAYLAFYGLERERVIGQSLLDPLQWPDTAFGQAVIDRYRRKGRLFNEEITIQIPSGEPRIVLASDTPFVLDGQQCTLATFIDITDRQQAEEQVRLLASQLTLAEQEERQRISAILHDDLQQRLYALQVRVVALRGRLTGDDLSSLPAEIDTIHQALGKAGEVARRLSVDLAPPILQDESLYHALVWLATQMKEQFGLEATIEQVGEWRRIDVGLRTGLFQVVRELLFNVAKHAGVAAATVTLRQHDDMLDILVRDEGAGFDAEAALNEPATDGQGLGMTRQRLELFGGRLDIITAPGRGTTAAVVVPIARWYI